jgi:hypothetical protein
MNGQCEAGLHVKFEKFKFHKNTVRFVRIIISTTILSMVQANVEIDEIGDI